ncbi:hypothetical protein NXX23_20925 [Bacteroides ovatus]|nr:hypothetical protein [Bacteroides ovatus]
MENIAFSTAKALYHFSYVGMSDQEIKVAGQTTINVVMKDDVAALDEVIVVGIWYCQKQSLTGAVSAVKRRRTAESLPAANVSSLFRWTLRVYFICSSIW